MECRASRISKFYYRLILILLGLLCSILVFSKLTPVWASYLFGLVHQLVTIDISYFVHDFGTPHRVERAAFISPYLKRAATEVNSEIQFTHTERDAFQTFTTQIRSLPVRSGNCTDHRASTTVLTAGNSSACDLKNVREIYRDTVLDIPKYEDYYDETLPEHLTAEFGEGLASVLLEDGTLTQQIQSVVSAGVAKSITERDQYLEMLEDEYNSIIDTNTQLKKSNEILVEIDPHRMYTYSFETLKTFDSEIRDATTRCEELLSSRQEEIRATRTQSFAHDGQITLQEHLYRSLSTSFPVLSAVTNQLRVLQERRRDVLIMITRQY